MKPDFKITLDGKEIFTNSNLIKSISITDEIDTLSDRVRIEINDQFENIAIPKAGVSLTVSLGYKGNLKKMGCYNIDDILVKPGSISVSGKGFSTGTEIKKVRSRNYQSNIVKDIVENIGKENNLDVICSDIFKQKINLTHYQESDINFLGRLAKSCDAIYKIQAGQILFYPKHLDINKKGEKLDILKISKYNVSDYNLVLSGRAEYKKVEAVVLDLDTGNRKTVSFGDERPLLRLSGTYQDEQEALNDCKSFLNNQGYASKKFSLVVPGNPSLKAGSQLELSNFKDGINGKWTIQQAQHELRNTYITNLELVKGKVINGA